MPATAMPKPKFIPFLILAFFGGLFWLPLAGLATERLAADELQKKAQQAYTAGRYAEAEAVNLEIAGKHPDSGARRYAVQMLGSLYENNLVDLGKAMKWYGVYKDEYADPRQIHYYNEKLVLLKRLVPHEKAYAAYQAIRFADSGDKIAVEKYEALLAEHPDFLLKARVLKELGYAYARLEKLRQSYLAFEALSRIGGEEFSASERLAYEKARRHWQLATIWAGLAWAVVVMLWAAALLMKPWGRMTRASIRNFLIWVILWALLTAIRMPAFYSIETDGDQFILNDTAVYIAAGLNLTVLLWLLLLTKGKFWQTRPRALRWASPVLTLLMTTAVFYLFIIHQPNGPQIIDVFVVKYRQWAGELQHP